MKNQLQQESYPERPDPGGNEWEDHHADHLSRYLYAAPLVAGRRVLDAGTGPGYGAALLKDAGASHVQAVDIDPATIDRARGRYGVEGLEFIVDDCQELRKVRASVEVVCSFENIEHLPEPEKFLAAAVRLLDREGVLLCSTPDRAGPMSRWVNGKPENPFHFTEWYLDEFQRLLSKYFRDIEIHLQVMSMALVSRRRAVENLTRHLSYLWSSPSRKLGRAVGKLVGRTREWPDIYRLAAPGPGDFPIVKAVLAPVHGQPHALFAICRGPKA